MAKEMTPVQVMNTVRPEAFAKLVDALTAVYGEDAVFIVGDSEVAVKVSDSPNGEPIYATYSPTIRNFTNRTTKTKTMTAYDAPKMAENFKAKCAEREQKEKENAEIKAKKQERDKKAREQKAKLIAEARAKKGEKSPKA